MGITNQLYQLEEIDLEIESEERTLSQKVAELGDRQVLEDAQKQLDEEQQQLDDLRRKHHDAEWEVDDLLSKISAIEEQLYGGKVTNPKELSNLQHEAATMKARSDQVENKALEIIDQVEAWEKTVNKATADYQALEEQWHRNQKQLSDDIAGLESSLADLRQRRQQLSENIESQAVILYEEIRQKKKPAVARVEQGICRVCRISLSASELQRARSGRPIQCGSCGRILFIS